MLSILVCPRRGSTTNLFLFFLTNWAIGLAKTGEASFARICLTLHETARLRELLVYWMAPPLERRPGASIYIHTPSRRMVQGCFTMAGNTHELRPKAPDTEKITINLGYVDLGHVDLMVQEGFYSNRTDFIRTAIRNQLERHVEVVRQSTARKNLDLGLRNYTREDLEAARRAGEMLQINVLGLATIAQDVTPELARATIASVSVLGALHATPAVKAALADRTR